MQELEGYSNNVVIDLFLSKYENIKSKVRYQNTVTDFLSFLNFKRILDISKEDILDHFDLIKDNGARVSHTKEFLKFLITEGYLHTDITNDGNIIQQIYNFRAIQKDPGRQAILYPLNTIIKMDIDIKKNYKYSSNNNKWDYERTIKIAFFWELLFDAGVKVGDIKSLKARYLTNKNEYLASGKKNAIAESYYDDKPNIVKTIINDYYESLLMVLNKKRSRDGFSSLLSLETYYNNDLEVCDLLAQDIIAARDKVYMKCPNCGREIKSTSNNWIFVKHNDSEEKHLACIYCKGNDVKI